jgi:hypothetical protein
MMRTEELYHSSKDWKYNWLLGRKVVKAEMKSVGIPGDRYEHAHGFLVLDNGTIVYVLPNEGCGGCESGNYSLSYLAEVDNIITAVEVVSEDTEREYREDLTTYRISVFAEEQWQTLIAIDGTDGNGYYGTGFQLKVLIPEGEILGYE